MDALTHAVSDLPIFKNLPAARLQQLRSGSTPVEFHMGSEVRTPAKVVLVILSGEINSFIRDAADKRFLLGTAGRGEVLGEMSYLVSEGNDQKVELLAAGDCSCLSIPAAVFFDVITSDASSAEAMLTMVERRLAAMNRFAKQVVDIDIDPTTMKGRTFSEKSADFISAKIGSWQFIAIFAVVTAAWTAANAVVLSNGWDPYPFIFLNLIFSIVSAATMPVLLMSQNRQSQMDRMAARVNHRVTLRSTQLMGQALKELRTIRKKVESLKQEPGDRASRP